MANEVSSIKYNGKVKISFVSKSGRPIKSIERHNQGCRPLFNFITSCMMGRYNDSNRPVYLMLYKKGENFSESNLGTYVLPNLQYLVSTENTYDALTNVGSVKYKFIFPGSLLLDDADVLALYNYSNATSFKSSNAPSNFVELTGDDVIVKDENENTNIIIIWELQFSDANE